MPSTQCVLVKFLCFLMLFALTFAAAEAHESPVVQAEDFPKSPSVVHECDVVQPIEALSRPELIAEHRSEFGTSSIWRTAGHLQLVINDVLMSDTRDERIYHEILVLPAMLAAERPTSQVLVIGGGEGATLREVLRHPGVENVTMVDIDEGTVNLCREYLAEMHQGSFDDSRARVIFGDGRAFAREAPAESYDVVVVDGVDFESCGEHAMHGNGLYSSFFYRDLYHLLKPGGALTQYMSEVSRVDEMLDTGFAEVLHLNVEVPSFAGGGARIALATKASNITGPSLPSLERRLQSGVEMGSPSAGWSYLAPETLSAGLDRAKGTDQIILQKSGGGGYGYGGRSYYAPGGYHHHHVIIVHRTGSPYSGNERCFDANATQVPCPHSSRVSWSLIFFVMFFFCICYIFVRKVQDDQRSRLSSSSTDEDSWQRPNYAVNPYAQGNVEMADLRLYKPSPGIAGYIAALRDEYVLNQPGAVGFFWDSQSGTLPPNFSAPYLQTLEDEVRDAPDKSLAVASVEARLMSGGGGFEPGATHEVI